MKRYTDILFPVIILSATLFTSCKKEPPLAEAIIGKWEVISFKYIQSQGGVNKLEVTEYLESGELALQFAEEGVGIMYYNNEMGGNFTWSLSGTTVTTVFADETVTWDINIDDDILVWTFTESVVEDNITYEYEFFYTAERTG